MCFTDCHRGLSHSLDGTTPLPSQPAAAAGIQLSGTTELSGRHSQLLALTNTIELLLGGLDASNSIDDDVRVLQQKFKQFEHVVQQASVEAIPLSQRRTHKQRWGTSPGERSA